MTVATAERSRLMTRRQAWLVCAVALLTALTCCALCAGAVLAPAPAGVAPLLAVCCIGMPIFGTWQVPAALDVLRGPGRVDASPVLAEFRRELARLPEAEHPLGW
jgi:hypothetical protein